MSQMKAEAQSIFEAGLRRVDPVLMIKSHLRLERDILYVKTETEEHQYKLNDFQRVIVLGAGKASARMALGLEEILGARITKGLVVVKTGHKENLRFIDVHEASHPVPDESSMEGAKKILFLASEAKETDLIINLISGGGSALAALPCTGLSLKDKQIVTKQLLASGATIHEINTVRKHLSQIKGGRLVHAMAPATSLNLILSDVMGDDLDTIASGMTAPDSKNFRDVHEIVVKYALDLPSHVIEFIKDGVCGKNPETPKKGDRIFDNNRNVIIGSNYQALKASLDKAQELGYQIYPLTSRLKGEAKEMATLFHSMAMDIQDKSFPISLPVCIVAGGETTVTLKGHGKGGRNQEMALSFLYELSRLEEPKLEMMFLSASTDGSDGPTDATGAFASYSIWKKAESLKIDPRAYLQNNDSYHFFDAVGELLKTGPTNTNVCDLQILLLKPKI